MPRSIHKCISTNEWTLECSNPQDHDSCESDFGVFHAQNISISPVPQWIERFHKFSSCVHAPVAAVPTSELPPLQKRI